MPPFNAELEVKAMDRRVSGLERKVDELDKILRQVEVKTLLARLDNLERVVKTLADTRKDSKFEAMDKNLKALMAAKLLDQDTARRMMDDVTVQQRRQLDVQVKTEVNKAKDELNKQNDTAKINTQFILLDNRVKIVEARLNSLGK